MSQLNQEQIRLFEQYKETSNLDDLTLKYTWAS